MIKKHFKKIAVFTAIGLTLFSNFNGITAFAASTTLIDKAFSGKNNIISGSTWASGYHSYSTTSSQGSFSCRLTERYSNTSPDRVVVSHTGTNYSYKYLSGGTYYIRYEGNSTDAKTRANLSK